MKKQFQLNLKLENKLPANFSITFSELKDWYLGKYKPNLKLKADIYSLNLRSVKAIDIIYKDADCIAGRFSIPVKGIIEISSIPIDFMIARNILERKKNRCAFRTEIFSQLTEKQVLAIHTKFVNKIVPQCLEVVTKEIP